MDNTLLSKLYEKYSKEILLYVYSLSHSWEIAEDITQEVFVKAILSLPESHTNVRAWLYMVARNMCFNQLRKNKNTDAVMDVLINEHSEAESSIERVEEDEQKKELYEALDSLEERYREVLVLQYYEGLSQKEIAAILKLSPENVRVLAHRAKAKLKEYMEKDT